MAEMTIEQQRALALAKARLRMQQPKRDIAAEIANDPISQGAQNVINATPAELIAGNPVARFALGAADPIMGAAQFVGNLFGAGNTEGNLASNPRIAQLQGIVNRGREAYGSDGFDAFRTAGNVLSPAALKAMKIAPAATAGGRIAQGAGIGAVAGGAAPVTEEGSYWGPKAAQVGAGAALGGAVTGGIEAARGVYNLGKQALEPAFAKGREAILNRYQQSLAGNKAQQMAKALRSAPEIVPGSQPTAGEALATIPESTGLAAHQKAVSQYVTPEGDASVSSAFARRLADQQGARTGMIGQGAKTPQELEAAIGARGAMAEKLYGAANKESVVPDSTMRELFSRPSMKKVLARANQLAEEGNQTFKIGKDSPSKVISEQTIFDAPNAASDIVVPATQAKYPVQSMHYVKMAMDDLIKSPETFGIGASEVRAIANTKAQFLSALENQSPAYGVARQTFADQSKPINNMQIMQELSRKLQGPSGKETPDMFLRAVDDRTPEAASRIIKKTTGFDRFDKLSDALTPQNAKRVEAVAQDLERFMQFQRNAAQSNVGGATTLATKSDGSLPNLLSRPAMITNWVMKKLGEGADEKIVKMAAERYLNPKQLADALEAAKASPQLMRAQKLVNPAIGITAFESARGMQP